MEIIETYVNRLLDYMTSDDLTLHVCKIVDELVHCYRGNKHIVLIGNGGSQGNAAHIANDLVYGVSKSIGVPFYANAIGSNESTLTCLGNDIGYDKCYSHQLQAFQANSISPLVIMLTGSGNSPNILSSIDVCNELSLKYLLLVGFNGGLALKKSINSIHVNVNDMQVFEDLQLILFHMAIRKFVSEI
jgi:D-sedoheptulose 7-phosphate isomerase